VTPPREQVAPLPLRGPIRRFDSAPIGFRLTFIQSSLSISLSEPEMADVLFPPGEEASWSSRLPQPELYWQKELRLKPPLPWQV